MRKLSPIAIIAACCACPWVGPPAVTTTDTGCDDQCTETSGPVVPDVAGESTDTEGTDGDGDGDASTRWAVVAVNDALVGWLATPAPDAIFPHDDIWSQADQGSPEQVFMLIGGIDMFGSEYGFSMHAPGVRSYTPLDQVLWTGPDCTGEPHARFAIGKGPNPGLSQAECDEIEVLYPDYVDIFFPLSDQFNATLDEQWPTAVGLLGQSSITPSDVYIISRQQAWPELMVANSTGSPTDLCVNLSEQDLVCSIILEQTDYVIEPTMGPYRLEERPLP